MTQFSAEGIRVDLRSGTMEPSRITVADGIIRSIEKISLPEGSPYLLPGFVDAHVHIESSMLVPSEFARLAVVHGTVATVSDPHEIANVLGKAGVEFMVENGSTVPFRFNFGVPACVPATRFESAGAALGPAEVEELLARPEYVCLSEMMNYPGVLHGDPEVHAKLEAAKRFGKTVDGHAPGVRGEEACRYFGTGITTDHECFTYEEAAEKARLGVKILIREGSAAKNFDALIPLLAHYPRQVMLCSDDKHPNDLVRGHIDQLVRRAIALGYPPIDALRAASLNPIEHYGLNVGLLQIGDRADFIVVDSLTELRVMKTYIGGELVSEGGRSLIAHRSSAEPNNFRASPIRPAQLRLPARSKTVRVIEVYDGQLVTGEAHLPAAVQGDQVVADPARDLLKLAVINRYASVPPAIGFVRNTGLKRGALASSVAHDSHNIVAVGTNDEDLASAINLVIEAKGGVSLADGGRKQLVPLPVAGLMSTADGYAVAEEYEAIDRAAKELGSTLQSPFMTLSFLALLVIPQLKLSDKGLFDGASFSFTELFL